MRKNSIATPVLLMSGAKINENFRHRGMSNHILIYKPFEINKMKKAIFEFLSGKIISQKGNLRAI